jgi:hypothetical protein
MINYYVIKVDSDWFEVRSAVGSGYNDVKIIDAFYNEEDAYSYASYLQNRESSFSE